MNKELRFIDLFAGCGGLSLGASMAGFKGVLAIEKQKNAFETLQHNLISNNNINDDLKFIWPQQIEVKNYDIDEFMIEHETFLKSQKGKIDLIVGGPPCQGFSTAGKRKKSDPRNQLYKSYLRFVDLVEPKIIVIENVSGIASKFNNQGRSYKDNIISKLKKEYFIDGSLLSSELFGVPQTRSRYFIIGFKKTYFKNGVNLNEVFEDLIQKGKAFAENYKVGEESYNIYGSKIYDAIGDLDGAEVNHPKVPFSDENAQIKSYQTYKYRIAFSNYQKVMRSDINGREIADSHRIGEHQDSTVRTYENLIKVSNKHSHRPSHKLSKEQLAEAGWNTKKLIVNVLKKDSYSPTITTCPFDYIHYNEPRILTVREFARLQSFPDWFEFKGVYALSGGDSYKTPRYSQIGNAVPPLMAQSILTTLKNYLNE